MLLFWVYAGQKSSFRKTSFLPPMPVFFCYNKASLFFSKIEKKESAWNDSIQKIYANLSFNMLKVYTDGGARGNPGPAAWGVYITDENNIVLYKSGQKIGVATNNVAEYRAVIAALSLLLRQKELHSHQEIRLYLDSKLIFSQIIGLFKIKNPALRELLFEVREKEAALAVPIRYFNIPREQNKEADKLVNMALDNKL